MIKILSMLFVLVLKTILKDLRIDKNRFEEYSNLNGIFKTCKKILDIEDKKGGFEHTIDGLILLPMYLPVKCSFEKEKIVNFR